MSKRDGRNISFAYGEKAQLIMITDVYVQKFSMGYIHAAIFANIFDCKSSLTPALLSLSEEHKVSLQEILSYSPFKTQKELLDEIDVITSSGKNTGTRIIIWNLRWFVHCPSTRNCNKGVCYYVLFHMESVFCCFFLNSDSSGKAEFDFDFDRYDIRMPSDVYQVTNVQSQHQVIKSYIPDCVYSLRVTSCHTHVFKCSFSVL